MEFAPCTAEVRLTCPELASRVEKFVTLEHVLNWLNADGYPLGRLDMVTQDEYSHDLIVPLPESGEWLVFGMT